jgi:hypothetical protein
MTMELFVDHDEVVYSAEFSDDGRYRYRLARTWGSGERMAWIMLNPSTADAEVDDPTIRRCMSFARRESYDGIEVINLYAWRATDPKHLLEAVGVGVDIEGPDNARHWDAVLGDHAIGMIVAAWGAAIGGAVLRSRTLGEWFTEGWYCLGTTKIGAPRHPLYVKGDTEFVLWRKP